MDGFGRGVGVEPQDHEVDEIQHGLGDCVGVEESADVLDGGEAEVLVGAEEGGREGGAQEGLESKELGGALF